MITHPRRLAIEASRFDLRVHRETTSALPDPPLLKHREYLLEESRRFRLSGVHSPKDTVCVPLSRVHSSKYHVRRCECANLQSHLVVKVVSTVSIRNLSAPRTCHRVRMLLILLFNAASFCRRSPDFHNSLRPGTLFLSRLGLTEFSHSSRSLIILHIVRPVCEREARPRALCEVLQVSVEFLLAQ